MYNENFSNVNLSFAGCGFMCIYHAGVVAAIKGNICCLLLFWLFIYFLNSEYAPQIAKNQIYGASAGSIAAVALVCNVSISESTSAILQVVCEVCRLFI